MRYYLFIYYIISISYLKSDNTFKEEIRPFLSEYCLDCHDNDSKKGGLNFEDLKSNFKVNGTSSAWEKILEQVEIGMMPPEKKDQPSATQRTIVAEWIKDELDRVGKGYAVRSRLLLPEYGNRISHELLFDGSVKDMPYTPARLWRISPHI